MTLPCFSSLFHSPPSLLPHPCPPPFPFPTTNLCQVSGVIVRWQRFERDTRPPANCTSLPPSLPSSLSSPPHPPLPATNLGEVPGIIIRWQHFEGDTSTTFLHHFSQLIRVIHVLSINLLNNVTNVE